MQMCWTRKQLVWEVESFLVLAENCFRLLWLIFEGGGGVSRDIDGIALLLHEWIDHSRSQNY